MDAAIREPIIIEKNGRPIIVMLAYEKYRKLEDAYCGRIAENIVKTREYLSGLSFRSERMSKKGENDVSKL